MDDLVGARKAVQASLLPGVQTGLDARSMFELLRADARYLDRRHADQYAQLEGTTPRRPTGREARWETGKPDFIGPSFPAYWGGSEQERREAERERNYSKQLRERLWGDESQ